MYTTEQQTYIDGLSVRLTGDPTPLLDYANGEPVNQVTFNRRQAIYAALFGALEDNRRAMDQAIVDANNDYFGDRYLAQAFAGTLDSGTRLFTVTAGITYRFGRRHGHAGEQVLFGVEDQYLVADASGVLAVRDKASYTPVDTEVVVGEWAIATGTFTPATPTAVFKQNVRYDAAVTYNDAIAINQDAEVMGELIGHGQATFNSDVVIKGNLFLDGGTVNQVTVDELHVGDSLIVLLADLPADTSPTQNAGIRINRGSQADAELYWNETDDRWVVAGGLLVSGLLDGAESLRLSGATPLIEAAAGDLVLRAATYGVYLQRENATTAGPVNFFNGKHAFTRDGAAAFRGPLSLLGTTPYLDMADTQAATALRLQLQSNSLFLMDATSGTAVSRGFFDIATGSLTLDGSLTVRNGLVQDDNGDNDFTITSRHGLVVNLDANNNGIASFTVKNGAGTTVYLLDESGNAVMNGSLTAGALYAYASESRIGRLTTQYLSLYGDAGRNRLAAVGPKLMEIGPVDAQDLAFVQGALDGTGSSRLATFVAATKHFGVGTAAPAARIDSRDTPSQFAFGTAADQGFLTAQGGFSAITSGSLYNGANWVARQTSAAGIQVVNTGSIRFNLDTGLVVGETFTPTELGRWTATGLGIGTTQPTVRLEVQDSTGASQIAFGSGSGQGFLGSVSNTTSLAIGALYNGANWVAKQTSAALHNLSTGAGHIFYFNTGLTVGNNFTPAEIARLNATGLGLGVSPSVRLEVLGASKLRGATTVGEANTDVMSVKALPIATDTRSVTTTKDGQGRLSTIVTKDGATTLKTVTYGYDANNRVSTRTTVADGKTITETFTYAATGDVLTSGYTKTVA